MFLEATRTLVRGRQPRSGLICILWKLMFLCSRGKRPYMLRLLFLCPYVLLFSALAAAKPRYGLICILWKLMFLCSRGKRLTRTLSSVLLFLCSSVYRVSGCQATQRPFVLMPSALAANLIEHHILPASSLSTCTQIFVSSPSAYL